MPAVGRPERGGVVTGRPDPDDVSRCPAGPACEVCGDAERLAVWTATTPVGVTCVTVCADCDDALLPLPRFSVGTAVRRVLAHAGHLGCTVDELSGVGGVR